MNRFVKFLGVVLLLFCAVGLFAQATMTTTTLSAAIAPPTLAPLTQPIVPAQFIQVASVTGFIKNGTDVFIDGELMSVDDINTTLKLVTVTRGIQGTRPMYHAVGATVYVGPPQQFGSTPLYGACPQPQFQVLATPYIDVADSLIFSCIGGVWQYSSVWPFAVGLGPNANLEVGLGSYQGTTSVGITDTNFHALVAASKDVLLGANAITTANRRIHIHGDGVYTNAAASLLNVEGMLCQVSGCGSGTIVAPAGCAVVTTNQANNLTNGQFSIDCFLISTSTVGASGTFMAKSIVTANLGAAVTAASSAFNDQATAVSAAVDETKNEFINIGFKFSTSNAGNSAILHDLTVQTF